MNNDVPSFLFIALKDFRLRQNHEHYLQKEIYPGWRLWCREFPVKGENVDAPALASQQG